MKDGEGEMAVGEAGSEEAEIEEVGTEEVKVEEEIADEYPSVELSSGIIDEESTAVGDAKERAQNFGPNNNNVHLITQREKLRSSGR